MNEAADHLYQKGYVVLSIYTANEVKELDRSICEEIMSGPEFLQDLTAEQKKNFFFSVQGGSFGALGSPSTWHTDTIRKTRLSIHYRIQEFLVAFSDRVNQPRVELLADRYRKQKKGTKVGSEKYHRDEAENALEDDVILGGWLNLSSEPSMTQYFSCLPGTQLSKNEKRGHAKCSPTQEQIAGNKRVKVKPGQMILFYQNIIHQVAAISKLPYESTRLHYGLRFTSSKEPLNPLDKVFSEFQQFRLPSGQLARLWPKLYWTNWPQKLAYQATFYKEELLEERPVKSGKDKGVKRKIIPEEITLTEEMQSHYKAYTELERSVYTPRLTRKKARKK